MELDLKKQKLEISQLIKETSIQAKLCNTQQNASITVPVVTPDPHKIHVHQNPQTLPTLSSQFLQVQPHPTYMVQCTSQLQITT